jgi:hypothetical protein
MPRTSWRVLSVLVLALGALAFAATSSAHDGHHDGDHHDGDHHKVAEHQGNHNTWRFSTTLVSPDTGTCADNVWANDTLNRTYLVHRSDDGSYRLTAFDRGSFVTVAGASPEACNTANEHHGTVVTAGIQGRIFGFISQKVTGGTFDPNATCAATCDRAAFVAAHFGPAATQSCSTDKSCRYLYVYHSHDQTLKFDTWIDRGQTGPNGPLVTSDRGDIATA